MDRPELGTELNIDGVRIKQYVAPTQGQDGTPVTAQDMNALFNELVGAIQAAGLTPDAATNDQIAETIRVLSARRQQQLVSNSAQDSPYGDNSIYGAHISDNAVSTRHVGDNQITAPKISVNASNLTQVPSHVNAPGPLFDRDMQAHELTTTHNFSPSRNVISGRANIFMMWVGYQNDAFIAQIGAGWVWFLVITDNDWIRIYSNPAGDSSVDFRLNATGTISLRYMSPPSSNLGGNSQQRDVIVVAL